MEAQKDSTWIERTKEMEEDLKEIHERLQSGEKGRMDVKDQVESVMEKAQLLEIEYER